MIYSKSFKLRFSNSWTENFQMYKLGFEEPEETEIKLPTFKGSWRKQGSSRKTSTYASLTKLKLLIMWITTNWKILKAIGVTDNLTCLLKNLYNGQEAIVRTRQGKMDWFKIGKGVWQGCIMSSCSLKFYAEYVMRNAGLDESEAGFKIFRRNINNIRYADNTILMEESEEELMSLLWRRRVKNLAWNSTLKKTKIMASSPITRWQIDGKKVEAVTDFIFLGSKITTDLEWSQKENYDKLRQCIKKQRDHFANILVKVMIFFSSSHVWMWKLADKEG